MTNNIQLALNGTNLIIGIDLAHNFGPSSTGKSDIIATTERFEEIPGRPDLILLLKVCRKLGK